MSFADTSQAVNSKTFADRIGSFEDSMMQQLNEMKKKLEEMEEQMAKGQGALY